MLYYSSLILRITAIISAIIAAVLYFISAGKLETKEQEVKQLQSEVQVLRDKNDSINAKYSVLQEKMAKDSHLFEEARTQVEEVKAEIVAEKQEKLSLQKRLTEAQQKVSSLEDTTIRLRNELIRVEERYAVTSNEGLIAQLNERITELTASNDKLKEEINTLYQSSGIPEISLSNTETSTQPTEQKPASPEVDSSAGSIKIASISTTSGIIVLDMDSKLKLTPNTTVRLVKNSEIVARVKIININGSLAIANILPGAEMKNLTRGDIVEVLR